MTGAPIVSDRDFDDIRIRRLIAAVSYEEHGRIVLEHALADACDGMTELHVVTIAPPRTGGDALAETRDVLVCEVEGLAREFADALGDEPAPIWVHARAGHPADEIAILADEIRADAIYMGPPQGPPGGGAGHTAHRLLDTAPCALLVIRQIAYPERDHTDVCSECARARDETDGLTWFCREHQADRVGHVMVLATDALRPTPLG